MAGAVAFVFGMCALSFAAGCVVTAVMLRREEGVVSDVAPDVVPVVGLVAAEVPVEVLRWPPEDFVERPIHRNPVVGFVGVDFDGPLAEVIELVPVGRGSVPVGVVGPELVFEAVELPDFEVGEVAVGVSARVSLPRQGGGNEEFRRRYLKRFEAARRRASH
ncbi:hypothetical protein [Umezawaea sp. Da 62-37]|uniref:hypothetical protein n=1 Tax=Umezawaea sp. Da 62-37 TaxID=3075927 RepID=UPI0028F70648|nr:hypothetical protein [Umezawaea sp. Da 62-37]WNV90040.1 hypothetical protein RM788_17600 [Umezawaea sp. Da 62-37]